MLAALSASGGALIVATAATIRCQDGARRSRMEHKTAIVLLSFTLPLSVHFDGLDRGCGDGEQEQRRETPEFHFLRLLIYKIRITRTL